MQLIILGAGGYGRTVADVAAQTGNYDTVFYLDDAAQGEDVLDCCANFMLYRNEHTEFYPAFGCNKDRAAWLHRLMDAGCTLAVIVHPTAYISPTAHLLPGTVVLPQAAVNTNCVLKTGCIVNCGAIVDHGCVLEEGVHVCLGAIVKAENRIPRCIKIEAGQVIENRTYPL